MCAVGGLGLLLGGLFCARHCSILHRVFLYHSACEFFVIASNALFSYTYKLTYASYISLYKYKSIVVVHITILKGSFQFLRNWFCFAE